MGQGREGNGLFLPAERTVSQTQLLRAWTQPAVGLPTLGLEKPGNVGFLPGSRMELEAFPRGGSGSLGRSPHQI